MFDFSSKWITLVACLISIIPTIVNSQNSIELICPSGWLLHRTRCYRIYDHTLSWAGAHTFCRIYGAHLVKIRDVYTNNDLSTLALERGISNFWIGLHSVQEVGGENVSSQWSDGEGVPVYHGFWMDNQPKLARGHCVYSAIVNNSPKWSYGTCEWKRNFVCEVKACPQGTFRCSDGTCVNSGYTCDGVEDCNDGSDEMDCPKLCRNYLTSPSGAIESPNYPLSYNSLDHCSWLIETDPGTYVQIQFNSISTELDKDEVLVFGGGSTLVTSSLISRLSGNVTSNKILSPNNFLLVMFSSNINVQLQGFQAQWTTVRNDVPSGGRNVRVSVLHGTLTSPHFASLYLPNQETLWILSTPKTREIITLQFDVLDLAPGDSLLIRAGDSADAQILRELKSSSPREKYILSTSNSLYLLLRTNNINTPAARGFSLKYYEGCKMVFDESHGYISSPGYDVINYANHMTCVWSISTPKRRRVTLIFEPAFEVDFPGDYVQIFAGEDESATPLHGQDLEGFSGSTAPPFKSVPGGRLFVKFITNSIINRKGFAARYSQGCSVPRFNGNTNIREEITAYDYGLVLTVYCDDGYSFNSEEFYERLADGTLVNQSTVQMECLYGGVWSVPRIPQCILSENPLEPGNRCGQPPTIANGYVITSTGTVYGDTATYTCVEGTLQGGATVTCNTDGTWSTPPTCSGSGVLCPNLTPPANARRVDVVGTYPVAGSVVRFDCDPGYQISGQPILLCGQNGQWNWDPPVCQELSCYVPSIDHGRVVTPSLFVPLSTSLTVTCDGGFQLQGSLTIQCQPNREFTQLPTCIDVNECVNSPSPCSPGEECVNNVGSFSCVCLDGFQRRGSVCVDIEECKTNNGNCDTINGSCVEEQGGYTCRCNAGYTLYTQNGTMGYYIPTAETGLHPNDIFYIDHTCVKNQCPTPPSDPDRIILTPQGTYHYGDRVRFDCHPGHDMQGSSEVTCEASGQWSTTLPICLLKACPFDDVSGITSPATFDTTRPVLYGQSLSMSCTVSGGSVERRRRTCQYDHTRGEYRLLGDSYDCQVQAQSCRDPKQALHAKAIGSNVGTSFRFMCEPYYIYTAAGLSLLNTHNVTCGVDGRWDYGDLHCMAMTCDYPGAPAGGEVVSMVGNYMYGTDITFRCLQSGYQLSKPYAIKCVQSEKGGSVTWNDTLPTCIDTEAPSFQSCPGTEVQVRLYDSAGFTVPQVVDNSGSVSQVTVTPAYFHPSWPVTKDLTVTYTATDHAGNQATCDVVIKIIDEEPPTIECLGSRYITADEAVQTKTFSDADVRAADNLGVPTVTFQPPSLSVSLTNVGENYTIVATATDSQANTKRCFFQIVVLAKTCHPDYLPVPANGQKTCNAQANGYKCDFTCKPGFHFYDDYPQDTFVSACQTGGQWSNADIPSCGALGRLGREEVLSVQYSGLTTNPTDVCQQAYLTDVRDKLASQHASLTTLCNVPGVSVSSKVTAQFDVINNQLTMAVRLPLLPYGRTESDYATCADRIIANFQQFDQPASLFSSLSSIDRSGCPSLQGRAGQTESVSVCEGRGTVSTVNGQPLCKMCPPGTAYNSTGHCQPCPVGTYQNVSGQITCEPCPQETWTDGIGKSSLEHCVRDCPGDLVSDTGLPPCQQCPPNMFKVNNTHCTACADGTMYVESGNPLLGDCTESACMYIRRENQQMVGGADIMTAVVGLKQCQDSCNQFRRRFAKRQCMGFNFFKSFGMCLLYDIVDSYQGTSMYDFYERICPEVTKADCYCAKKCPPGTFSYNGYEPHHRGCPLGYFTNTPGATRCQECPQGQTTTGLNSTTCVSASSVLCKPGPCNNSGTCRIVGHWEECDCAPGFTGRYCNSSIDTCASQPCYNGGSCQVTGTTFSCSCNRGYTGSRCETNINDCAMGQCGDSGVCIDGVGTAQCLCMDGYSGQDCQSIDVGACERYPCQNGGTCIPTNNYWRTCNCPPGYTGEDCERQRETALCKSSTCLNGGTCSEIADQFFCTCLSGFGGNRCQTRNQTCALRDCGPSAGCIDDPVSGLSQCVCPVGYTLSQGNFWTQWFNIDNPADGNEVEMREAIQDVMSPICFEMLPVQSECRIRGETTLVMSADCTIEGIQCTSTSSPCPDYEVRFRCSDIVAYKDSTCVLVDHCSTNNPCQNRGVCENIEGGYRCECPDNFTGSHCQHSIHSCASHPCLNQGTCTETTSGFRCDCVAGYDGRTCENNPDDCVGVCDTVGTHRCVDGVADYTCVCLPGYTDKNCSTDIDECASAPCLQSGTCVDGVNDYVCSCPTGWTGKNCDVIMDQCSISNPCAGNTECYTLFNDVHCSCAGVSSGSSCVTVPDICQTANPCVSPATCITNTTSTSCVCPLGRTGANCELMASTECTVSTVCENGGTCTRSGSGEIQCSCVRGYEGSRCERNVDNCAGVTCPASSTCTDGLQQYFCRCPVGKVPPLCVDDINTDYDLCFPDSVTLGSAALPYSIPVTYTDGFSITLWVKFSAQDGSGTFFSLYQDLSEGSLTSTQPVLYISDQGLYSYLDNSQIRLPFLTSGQQINDGEWHNIVVTWHTDTAVLRLIMDDVSQHQQEDFISGLPLPSRLWVSLGSHPPPPPSANSPVMSEGSKFHGCVSQVNIYSRQLDTNTETAVLNTQPRYVFDSGSVLRWSEYSPVGSTLVTRPSTATLNTCPAGFTYPPTCTTPRRVGSPVRVLFCPENQFLEAASGSVQVYWQDPRFVGATSITSNYSPGVVLSTGSHAVVYEARDDLGNVASCSFIIFINSEMCSAQDDPRGGGDNPCQTSNGSWPITACRPTCPAPRSSLVQSGPVYFTCGPGGDWMSLDQNDGLYPACGQMVDVARVDVKLRLRYRITSPMSCEQRSTELTQRIQQNIISLNFRWGGVLCQFPCQAVNLSANCNSFPFTDVEVTIPNVSPILNNTGGSLTPRQIITRAGLDEDSFTFTPDISGATPDVHYFDVTETFSCPPGQVALDSICYKCGPGTYQNSSTNSCLNCPLGQYQSGFGASNCEECPAGETTQNVGQIDLSACSPMCNEGEFYNLTSKSCESCPLGTYQNLTGKFSCQQCPVGQVTASQGAVTEQECKDGCESGYQYSSDGQCTLCPVGTYRTAQVDQVCQDCPPGFITPTSGTTSSIDCTVVACPVGQFRDVNSDTCQLCPAGTYQETQWQTTCTSCGGERYRTDTLGATSASQCRFFCPSGSEAVNANTSCQVCPVGQYKDNVVDIYSSCLPCPENRVTTSPGTTSVSGCIVLQCAAGYQIDQTGTQCELCPRGTYQPLENQARCQSCGDGQTTAQEGSTSQTQCIDTPDCPAGQQLVGSVCEDCAQGFYKDTFQSVCQQCPSGYVTAGLGATSSTDCSIRDCPAGTRIVSGTNCESCPTGTFQSQPYQNNCVLCDPGYFTNITGATSANQCLRFCPSGQEVVVGGGCSPCERGTYKDNRDGIFLQCQTCPVEYITSSTGADSSSLCTVRNCSAGYRLNEADNSCVECGIGFYQSQQWQTQCQQCLPGTVTMATTSTSSTDCLLICTAGSEDRNGVCQPCNLGFFKTQEDATPCQQCPNGFRTSTEGATSQTDCNIAACEPGSYRNTSTNQCLQCAMGQYQPDEWQDTCLPCPDKLVTYNQGAVSQNQCQLECESGKEYNHNSGQCEDCPQGYYRDAADREDRCQACPPDRITPTTGATSVIECTIANCSVPGQYLNTSSNQCVECPMGTFQDQRWAVRCQDCAVGFTTRSKGTASYRNCYRDCRSGTQVIESDNTCRLCPVGQYRSRGDMWTCVLCDVGFTTPGRGSTSVSDCRPICNPGTVYNSDVNACQTCLLGSFQSRSNQDQCTQCPQNQTTQSQGSISIEECYSFCSTRRDNCTGATECVDRPYGFTCQCSRAYVGEPHNCTHVCDLPSYCTNQGVCRKEVFPTCLCPELFRGDTCEIRLEPSSNVNNTIIGTVIGVTVFLLLLALILVGIYSRRRRRGRDPDESSEETDTDGVSMTPSSYMTLRTNTAPYSMLMLTGQSSNSDPAFYSAKQQSEVDRGYIQYGNDVLRM